MSIMEGIDLRRIGGHAAMLAANVIWGAMAPAAKYVMRQASVSGLAVTGFRILGACALFWAASLFQRREEVPRRDMLRLMAASLLCVVLNQGSYVCGVQLTSPVDASVITTALPIITMVLSALILREPITWLKALGVALGLSGAVILVANAGDAAGGSSLWGNLLCLSAQLSFAFYAVLFKDLAGRYSPATIMKWMFLWASAFTMPLLLPEMLSVDLGALGSGDILGLSHIVVGGTFVAYFLIPIGQSRLRPTVFVMYNYIQPVVSAIISVAAGITVFGWRQGLAAMLIFAGVFAVAQSKSRADLDRLR